ncbi:MAG: tetratricopeptide repeat protein [Candidatus Sumerlaeaceae bacterium]|nr:tetratricopeptide repeat protein [Candidatus Sumerlaeaceae bacterium]
MKEYGDFELNSADAIFQQGLDLLECDHFEEALRAFDFVVSQQPYNADAFFHRGIALVNLNRSDEAAGAFKIAVELAPTEALFHTHFGYALMLSSKLVDAIEQFDKALELSPDNYQNKIYKACALAENRNLHGARALLKEVLEEHPDDLDARRNHGNIAAAMGDDELAIEEYSVVLRKQPNNLDVLRRRAEIFQRQSRQDDAIRAYREIVAIDPRDRTTWMTLVRVLGETGDRPAVIAHATEAIDLGHETAEIYVMRGKALLEQKQTEQSITDLRRARELNDRLPEAHHLLSRAFMESGRLGQAVKCASRALQLNPRDIRFLLMKAALHHRLGEYDAEFQYLTAIAAEIPGDFEITRRTVENHLLRKQPQQAVTVLEEFLGKDPDHSRALLLFSELNERLGNVGQTLWAYRRIFSQKQVEVEAFLAFARFLVRQADTNQALQVLDRGAAIYRDHAAIHLWRAEIYHSLGRHEECIARIQEFGPGPVRAPAMYWLLGKSYYAIGGFQQALKAFGEARKHEEQAGRASVPPFRCLVAEAWTLHHLGRTGEGIALLGRYAGKFDQFEREYHEVLGELYENAGTPERALEVYSEGLRKYPKAATLHYRMARTAAATADRKLLIKHLDAAVANDGTLADTAANDPVFQKFAYSPSLNRVLGFRFYRRRAKLLTLMGLWIVALLVTVYLANH